MPLNIDIQQILLHMLNFTILFAALYFLLYNPVKKFMDNRDKYFEELDKNANCKLSEAEAIKAEYELKLEEIKANENRINAEAVEKANIQSDSIISKAKSDAEEILSTARTKAVKEKEAIVNSANEEIKNLAEAAAEKIIMQDNEDAYNSFLDTVESSQSGE